MTRRKCTGCGVRKPASAYYLKRPDRRCRKCISKRCRVWALRNKPRFRAAQKRWEHANKAKLSEWKRADYAKRPHVYRERNARREADIRQAMPKWANLKAIRAIYAEARRISRATGRQHHVDHIIPLHSPFVCGLHVETNLQIIPGPTNSRKGNRTWPGFTRSTNEKENRQ